MANNQDNINADLELIDNNADIELSKTSKARFLFIVGFSFLFLFMAGCFFGLGKYASYDSNADVEVPESATYNPKYK